MSKRFEYVLPQPEIPMSEVYKKYDLNKAAECITYYLNNIDGGREKFIYSWYSIDKAKNIEFCKDFYYKVLEHIRENNKNASGENIKLVAINVMTNFIKHYTVSYFSHFTYQSADSQFRIKWENLMNIIGEYDFIKGILSKTLSNINKAISLDNLELAQRAFITRVSGLSCVDTEDFEKYFKHGIEHALNSEFINMNHRYIKFEDDEYHNTLKVDAQLDRQLPMFERFLTKYYKGHDNYDKCLDHLKSIRGLLLDVYDEYREIGSILEFPNGERPTATCIELIDKYHEQFPYIGKSYHGFADAYCKGRTPEELLSEYDGIISVSTELKAALNFTVKTYYDDDEDKVLFSKGGILEINIDENMKCLDVRKLLEHKKDVYDGYGYYYFKYQSEHEVLIDFSKKYKLRNVEDVIIEEGIKVMSSFDLNELHDLLQQVLEYKRDNKVCDKLFELIDPVGLFSHRGEYVYRGIDLDKEEFEAQRNKLVKSKYLSFSKDPEVAKAFSITVDDEGVIQEGVILKCDVIDSSGSIDIDLLIRVLYKIDSELFGDLKPWTLEKEVLVKGDMSLKLYEEVI